MFGKIGSNRLVYKRLSEVMRTLLHLVSTESCPTSIHQIAATVVVAHRSREVDEIVAFSQELPRGRLLGNSEGIKGAGAVRPRLCA